MPVAARAIRHGTLQRDVLTADGTGGDTGVWTSLASFPMRLHTVSARQAFAYKREGFENVIRVQAENRLAKRVAGHKTLRDLMMASGETKLRILFRGRTLSPIGTKYPNDGMITGNGHVLIDCIETPQPVGYMDEL